jgi:hypothetical protein
MVIHSPAARLYIRNNRGRVKRQETYPPVSFLFFSFLFLYLFAHFFIFLFAGLIALYRDIDIYCTLCVCIYIGLYRRRRYSNKQSTNIVIIIIRRLRCNWARGKQLRKIFLIFIFCIR